jgi:hypothetical protein
MVKLFFLIIGFLLFIPSCSSTQLVTFNDRELIQTNNGRNGVIIKVIDFDTSEPLIGANITILGSDLKNIPTNYEGIAFLTKGIIGNIKISFIGYETVKFAILDTSIDNILVRMKTDNIMVTEYAFMLDKDDAKKDISNGIIQLYQVLDDSTQLIYKELASKYGFKFNYPDGVFMIIDVEEYNNTVIKFLENRNGTNWYERFENELNARIAENSKK